VQPKFLYFDLGKVLLDFSVEQMCAQVGVAAGIDPARVADAIYNGGLQAAYESGRISTHQFYDGFCARTGTRPEYADLLRAFSDIFTPKPAMWPLVARLARAGHRLGILSNTCEAHWEHCRGRYALLREDFSVYALSFQVAAMKPAAAIFQRAAELAGCRPEEIFYTDDMPGHVAGAQAVGFDAVVFTSAEELAEELCRRGVRIDAC
jgi:FMN phosphatase YigB (HAD superfamily)